MPAARAGPSCPTWWARPWPRRSGKTPHRRRNYSQRCGRASRPRLWLRVSPGSADPRRCSWASLGRRRHRRLPPVSLDTGVRRRSVRGAMRMTTTGVIGRSCGDSVIRDRGRVGPWPVGIRRVMRCSGSTVAPCTDSPIDCRGRWMRHGWYRCPRMPTASCVNRSLGCSTLSKTPGSTCSTAGSRGSPPTARPGTTSPPSPLRSRKTSPTR